MATFEYCKTTLQEQFIKDFTQKDAPSKLMTDARWSYKSECISLFWWMSKINNFLTNVQNNYEQQSDIYSNIQVSQQTWPAQTPVETAENTWENTHGAASTEPIQGNNEISWFTQWLHTARHRFVVVVILLFLFLILKNIIKKLFKWWYAFFNHNRMIYLKVLVPRWDSKVDREQAKEVAKDMKEKIWRMSQVYANLSKLWKLNLMDKILYRFFRKPTVSLIYHYENWVLNFIIWCYPEYKTIIEWWIWAQYPESSIEIIKKPNIFKKKYSKVMPLQDEKDSVYTLKLYKKMSDDPINNIIDAIWNISRYDTATIMLNIKPLRDEWNEEAKVKIDRLYKNLDLTPEWFFWKLWKLLKNFFNLMISWENPKWPKAEDVTMVRMVKAQEDTLNDMWEEAGAPAFESWLLLITSSDEKEKLSYNMENLIWSFSVYTDEYWNELEQLENKESILWFIAKPLWNLAAQYGLTNLFYKSNTFTTWELTWLFHLPDYTYNRANSIEWMQYKVVPAPSNLPTFIWWQETWYIISWSLAEAYKWWNLSDVLSEYKNHRAVWKKTVKDNKLVPIEEYKQKDLEWKEIIEKDGQKFVKEEIEKEVYWYKVFKDGILLGTNIYRNKYSPVYMKREDRTRHHYCIWKSWTWKSVFLQTLARQDMWNGDWLCVIDPHWDLVEDLLHYVPKERAKDVIFFDAWNEDRPMWLNLYEINNIDEADRTVNDATEIFLKMFGPEIFGPRIQEYFKYGSLTVLEDFEDRPTILDITRLFTDESFRERKVALVKNPTVRNFWEKTYNAMWDREKAEIIPYFSSKFVSFNTNRLIRNIIWQTKSAFNIEEVMNNQKILLISLSKWKIWDINAQLLWMILVSKIYNAAMWRAKMPEKERKDFYLYVDEFQNFVSWTFADILSEARKYRLALIMAHQYIAQLEAWQGLNKSEWWKWDVKAAVFGNVWTMMSFKVGAPDAEFLEKEYQPVLWAWDITWIANYKAYIKLNIDNATTRPFSMNAIYTKDYNNPKIVDILKEYSAKKYWRDRRFVDAEMAARLWMWFEDEEENNTQNNKWNINESTNTTEDNVQNDGWNTNDDSNTTENTTQE